MLKVLTLIGVPCSGKTTYRNKYYPNINSIISTDDFIEQYVKNNNITYNDFFKDKNLFNLANQYKIEKIKNAKDFVIWDQTLINKKSRKNMFQQLKQFHKNYMVDAVVFDPQNAKEILFERNKIRNIEQNKFIPLNVIEDMINNFEMPSIDEGFNSIKIINVA